MSRPQSPLRVPDRNARRPNSRPATPQPMFSGSAGTSAYSLLSPEETEQRLNSSLTRGLIPSDAEARFLRDGPNELPHEEPEPLWLRFIKAFNERLILLLLLSAAVSLFLGNTEDAISIAVAVTIVITVGFVQEYRSEKSIESLNKLVPYYAHLIRGTPENKRWQGRNMQESPETEMIPNGNSVNSLEAASDTVQARQLVQGDLVIFSSGDRIPADIRITSATGLSIDESNLTGENEPTHKQSESIEKSFASQAPSHLRSPSPSNYASPAAGTVGADIRLNEQVNIAFMGTLVRSGHGKGLVIGTGGSTEFGAISASMKEIESPRTPLQLAMDLLGQQLSYLAFAVIAVIVLVGWWQGRAILDMLQIGVSLAVAAIPEGLPVIVTVTLALGVMRMNKRGAKVRKMPSVETLGSVNVICSDKTGTLTLNHMTATKIWHFDAASPIEVNPELTSSVPDQATRTILRVGNVANNARLSRDHANSPASASSAAIMSSTLGHDPSLTSVKSRWVGQPTDVAILDLLDAFGDDDIRDRIGSRSSETPFSSERKWMGVVTAGSQANGTGTGPEVAYIKGALEQVLKRCDTYLSKEGREIVFDEQRRKEALSAAETMAQEGLRVLGFASGSKRDAGRPARSVPVSSRSSTPRLGTTSSPSKQADEEAYQGLVFAGIVGMNDPPRKDVDSSIRRLMKGGVTVIMITGDAEATAVAIATRIGMHVGVPREGYRPVLRGDELDQMSEEDLAQSIAGTSIFARTSPEHKMKIVRALQSRGDIVAMTGDGVNDAPALKKADIGIAMGVLGTDVAKEAADMILTNDDFSTILNAIEEGKGIFSNIQNFLTFQLSTSLAALTIVLFSSLLGFESPLNATQILWINILMDGPPAQSLGVEPVDPAVMNRPPRSKNDKVLTWKVVYRVLTSGFIIMFGTLMVYWHGLGADNKINARDTTLTFTCFVLFDMFNALTCRSEGKSILRGEVKLMENRSFNFAVGGSLLGQLAVIYLPFLQSVFETEALALRDLGLLICIASSVFWVDEGRKFYKAHNRRRNGLGGYSTSV